MWSHVLHRVSGLALLVYLTMHIWVIHHVQKGEESYDALMRSLSTAPFRVGESLLLAAILFHSINGIRIAALDAGIGMRNHRATFWIVFAVCAVLGITGGIYLVFLAE